MFPVVSNHENSRKTPVPTTNFQEY